MKQITRDTLRAGLSAGELVLLEALPAAHFARGHIPEAKNAPLAELRAQASTLVPHADTPVVVYCSGPTCRNSAMAAEVLRSLGYTDVAVYEGGKSDWAEAGLPLTTAR